MARKLGLGWGILCGTLLLAGCQTGTGSRFASNPTANNAHGPAVAKQATPPQPQFPMGTTPASPGFGTATSSTMPPPPNMPSGFQNSTSGFASQNTVAPVGAANNPPQGPQGLGNPTAGNRNVTVTTPPSFAPPPPPQAQLATPGISPVAPPPPSLPNIPPPQN